MVLLVNPSKLAPYIKIHPGAAFSFIKLKYDKTTFHSWVCLICLCLQSSQFQLLFLVFVDTLS